MPQPLPQPLNLPPEREAGPSMLDLVRLSTEVVFPPGGEELYRRIGALTDMHEGMEVLDCACGRGVSTLFLADSYGVQGTGADPDETLIRQAERRAREAGLEGRFTFETARPDDLPYRDGIFDVAIGEIGLAASSDPARAVSELARVTKPFGCVVLVQLIWTQKVEPERREILVQHLGARPMILVEWKQLLRDAGVVELTVEDWSRAPSPVGGRPVPGLRGDLHLSREGGHPPPGAPPLGLARRQGRHPPRARDPSPAQGRARAGPVADQGNTVGSEHDAALNRRGQVTGDRGQREMVGRGIGIPARCCRFLVDRDRDGAVDPDPARCRRFAADRDRGGAGDGNHRIPMSRTTD
jgi:SAM-dependent methyltransferase